MGIATKGQVELNNSEIRFSEAGEKLIGQYFPVLDQGYVSLVSYHGTDQLIEAGARVSYQKGTRKVSDTRNLLRFLIRNQHCSPLELPNCTFLLKMPLYVIQQLLRHRTAKLNQESHRYSEISGEMQVTDPREWRLQSGSNKQGSDGFLRSFDSNDLDGEYFSQREIELQELSKNVYDERIKSGIAKEQARKETPHSTYSSLYWQMDLRNLLHFLGLRCDSHAQLEIRVYANVIAGIVKELFPLTFEAWYDYAFAAKTLSRIDIELLRYVMTIRDFNKEDYVQMARVKDEAAILGLSSREVDEFLVKIGPQPQQDFTLDYSRVYTKE